MRVIANLLLSDARQDPTVFGIECKGCLSGKTRSKTLLCYTMSCNVGGDKAASQERSLPFNAVKAVD